jgi:hypothetical protein
LGSISTGYFSTPRIVTSDLALHTQTIPSLPKDKDQRAAPAAQPQAGENAARNYMIQKN